MLLQKYIDLRQLTQRQAAEELAVPSSTMHRWCAGECVPRPDEMRRIIQWSDGAVMPNDFYTMADK